ncbi:MAG: calcium/sodium antiporter [Bacteroidota bacterium]
MILLPYIIFVVSLTVLLRASDWFIDSAEQIGLSLGISPFIIGVTIVAFGTSLPELATSIQAVLNNEPEIVMSAVVGSNITNIALVLGLVALIVNKIDLEYNIWHIDMPYLWGSAFLLYFMVRDLTIDYFEAVICIIGIITFLAYSMKNNIPSTEERPKVGFRQYFFLVLGGVLVWLSSDYAIESIKEISATAGIPSSIISVSAVALGTSLPEIIVSLNAARKGKASIAVGNVLGSNIFNTYVVVGIPSLLGPLTVPANVLSSFLPIMLVMTVLFGIMSNNKTITRWEGVVLVMFYLVFLAELFSAPTTF